MGSYTVPPHIWHLIDITYQAQPSEIEDDFPHELTEEHLAMLETFNQERAQA